MGGGVADKLRNLLIILPIPEPTRELEDLRKRLPHMNIKFMFFRGGPNNRAVDNNSTEAGVFEDVDVLITLAVLPKDHKKTAPRLRLVHFYSAGTDEAVNNPMWSDPNIVITSSSGIHGPQIAEWVVMTGLTHSHYYDILHQRQKEHKWAFPGSDGAIMRNIHDKVGRRMGILGYGSIGGQIGRMAKAMGMEVLAYTASPKNTPESRKDKGYIVPGTGDPNGEFPSEWYYGLDKASLHHFLRQNLDWLVISLPLTADTHHMLAEPEFRELAKQKPPFVSNISRGPIIKQDDLIEALKNGAVRGAALDVTDPEPLPPENPLWDAPNVTINPHVSGLSSKYSERSFDICAINVERWTKGEKLLNVVNRKRGY